MSLRQFLSFTALTLPACVLLIFFLDQPLALFFYQYFGWAMPFFGALTAAADATHGALKMHVVGIPVIFLALGVAFVVGRYVLRQRGATLFLVLLLTHEFSMVLARVLKGVVHRLRPEVLFGTGYPGLGLWQPGPHNDSFPSTHTAVYFSLFWPLAVAFPRWRVPLLALPVLIGVGRLVLGAHYLSDVWFSLWLVAGFTYLFGLLGQPRFKVDDEEALKAD
ncbi:phosphatase PAP2 family protein [Hymenobacter sp. BT683]|uniref:Phosphatase PAP2 family protein n=1 Tax=Hymenobacter jeongseonensis TaxID=2791027 RepID=A0ABS0IHF7_9BACT|nr:phosphatase PAP2 family protein [Hymenobacter jeongseonensis]MBF9237795.1 phosphatase PAP2 family protein [Hymenobacter jeongseonensis]